MQILSWVGWRDGTKKAVRRCGIEKAYFPPSHGNVRKWFLFKHNQHDMNFFTLLVLVLMRTTARSTGGLVGQDQFPREHAENKVVTVTTINKPGTIYGKATVMVSQVRAAQGSTTTETGVSSIFGHFSP